MATRFVKEPKLEIREPFLLIAASYQESPIFIDFESGNSSSQEGNQYLFQFETARKKSKNHKETIQTIPTNPTGIRLVKVDDR